MNRRLRHACYLGTFLKRVLGKHVFTSQDHRIISSPFTTWLMIAYTG